MTMTIYKTNFLDFSRKLPSCHSCWHIFNLRNLEQPILSHSHIHGIAANKLETKRNQEMNIHPPLLFHEEPVLNTPKKGSADTTFRTVSAEVKHCNKINKCQELGAKVFDAFDYRSHESVNTPNKMCIGCYICFHCFRQLSAFTDSCVLDRRLSAMDLIKRS